MASREQGPGLRCSETAPADQTGKGPRVRGSVNLLVHLQPGGLKQVPELLGIQFPLQRNKAETPGNQRTDHGDSYCVGGSHSSETLTYTKVLIFTTTLREINYQPDFIGEETGTRGPWSRVAAGLKPGRRAHALAPHTWPLRLDEMVGTWIL